MVEQRILLPEQAAAAYEIDKHISVTAGPGSGKTTVLVERYLHILLKHNLSIDQIVAITFTNRAANEMRLPPAALFSLWPPGRPTAARGRYGINSTSRG